MNLKTPCEICDRDTAVKEITTCLHCGKAFCPRCVCKDDPYLCRDCEDDKRA